MTWHSELGRLCAEGLITEPYPLRYMFCGNLVVEFLPFYLLILANTGISALNHSNLR